MKFTSKSNEFKQWALEKEDNIPLKIDDLIVKIQDINHATLAEISNIKDKIKRFNCCIYQSKVGLNTQADLINFAQCIGMETYDTNNIHNSPIASFRGLPIYEKEDFIYGLEGEIEKTTKTFKLGSKQQEHNLIDALKIACRKFTKEKTGKKPFTNINLVKI